MKYRCTVCGYIHEGSEPPAFCPQCKAPADKFVPTRTFRGHSGNKTANAK